MPTPLNIFISHKHDDATAAIKVRDRQRVWREPNRHLSFLNRHPPGSEWLPFIREKLRSIQSAAIAVHGCNKSMGLVLV